jgi:hypothetical protein
MATAVDFPVAALQAIPNLVAAGQDIEGFINHTADVLTAAQAGDGLIPQAEWDALNARIADLRAQLNASIPGSGPGTSGAPPAA